MPRHIAWSKMFTAPEVLIGQKLKSQWEPDITISMWMSCPCSLLRTFHMHRCACDMKPLQSSEGLSHARLGMGCHASAPAAFCGSPTCVAAPASSCAVPFALAVFFASSSLTYTAAIFSSIHFSHTPHRTAVHVIECAKAAADHRKCT
jgi:hypothetical protein